MGPTPNIATKKKYYEYFFGCFENFQEFRKVYDRVTDGYNVLVANNTAKSTNMNNVVSWYRAAVRGPFRMGSRAFWNYPRPAGCAAIVSAPMAR